MDEIILAACIDELEKIAAGPKIIHHDLRIPGQESKGPAGGFIPRGEYDRMQQGTHAIKNMPKVKGLKPGQDVVSLPPSKVMRAELRKKMGSDVPKSISNDLYKMTRRHELTHWLRNKRGKMPLDAEGRLKPGLRNVARTAREEAVANVAMLKGAKNKTMRRLTAATIPINVVNSVRGAYSDQGGVLRNAAGGTLKRIGKALRLTK